MEEVELYFPSFRTFIDATEQEISRPKNKRKSYYSGKRHTVKIQYIVNDNGLILHKTGHERGMKHDYSIYKEKQPITLIG